jgi:hypothetical protein
MWTTFHPFGALSVHFVRCLAPFGVSARDARCLAPCECAAPCGDALALVRAGEVLIARPGWSFLPVEGEVVYGLVPDPSSQPRLHHVVGEGEAVAARPTDPR